MSLPPIRIAPSILSADFGRLSDEIVAITAAGADLVHIDVMDGHFVPNLTIGPMIVEVVRRETTLPLDVHLMITNADEFIERYAQAGADVIGVHAEASTHLHRTVSHIRSLGKKACVVLNPATPIDAVRYVLGDIDQVLIMSVNPGFGGQSFIRAVLPKVCKLRALILELGLSVDIEIDGGLKMDNVAEVVAAGVNVLVSGSGIFKGGDYQQIISAMRKAAQAAQSWPLNPDRELSRNC